MRPFLRVFLLLAATLAVAGGMLAARSAAAAPDQAGGSYAVDMEMPHNPELPWSIGDIWHYAWSDEVSDEPGLDTADGRLVFRDASGVNIYQRLVARHTFCNGHCEEVDTASAEIPAQPDAAVAELYTIDPAGGALELKASRARSPGIPVVQFLSPQPGETIRDGTVIEWSATDSDGDPLRYHLLYRPSVGELQQTALDVNMTTTRLVFERYDLPADTDAEIAVIANDGFNTVEATVGPLILEGNQAPEVYVSSPRHGDVYEWGSNIILMAFADDAEDGELPVLWNSDLDGDLPDDPNWATGSQGRHVLTASAVDSGSLEAAEQMVIYIGVEPPQFVYLPAVRSGR